MQSGSNIAEILQDYSIDPILRPIALTPFSAPLKFDPLDLTDWRPGFLGWLGFYGYSYWIIGASSIIRSQRHIK